MENDVNSMKEYKFSCNSQIIVIKILEILDASYGLYVWPCAPVLAQFIAYHETSIVNKQILEIGCGTALVGILAGKLGGVVTLTDSSRFPQCLELAKKCVALNDLKDSINVKPLDWGDLSSVAANNYEKQDIIIGSDCFYDVEDFEPILATVSYILQKNSLAQFWTTYQLRSFDRSIEHLLCKWNLHAEEIELKTFGADKLEEATKHTILMFIIKQNIKINN